MANQVGPCQDDQWCMIVYEDEGWHNMWHNMTPRGTTTATHIRKSITPATGNLPSVGNHNWLGFRFRPWDAISCWPARRARLPLLWPPEFQVRVWSRPRGDPLLQGKCHPSVRFRSMSPNSSLLGATTPAATRRRPSFSYVRFPGQAAGQRVEVDKEEGPRGRGSLQGSKSREGGQRDQALE